MNTGMGEYLVGAYLKVVEDCDVVSYNTRPPGGGLKGLEELDVIGLKFSTGTAFLCEVTTHIRGLLYKDGKRTVKRVAKKYERQKEYAERHLADFPQRRFQFWSPVVPRGYLTDHLPQIADDLELVINEAYAERVSELRDAARRKKNDENNPAFRLLQILEHLRSERTC